MAAKLFGLENQEVQGLFTKENMTRFSPEIDRNMQRAPDRIIHIFSISQRSFTIKRPPLFTNVYLRACPKGTRYVPVYHIPDPFMQAVHDTEKAKQRGEANDGMLCAVELLNPNNPTYDPDWMPPAEMAAAFSSSKGCDLFKQGLFLSLGEEPTEREIASAERRRAHFYQGLIEHADSLEQTNRKELEEFIRGEEGVDLRMALDFFGEKRDYHKPMTRTIVCPVCADDVKQGAAYHKNSSTGEICVIDWQRAVAAGVKQHHDVPKAQRGDWWYAEQDEDEAEAPRATPAAKPMTRQQQRDAAKAERAAQGLPAKGRGRPRS